MNFQEEKNPQSLNFKSEFISQTEGTASSVPSFYDGDTNDFDSIRPFIHGKDDVGKDYVHYDVTYNGIREFLKPPADKIEIANSFINHDLFLVLDIDTPEINIVKYKKINHIGSVSVGNRDMNLEDYKIASKTCSSDFNKIYIGNCIIGNLDWGFYENGYKNYTVTIFNGITSKVNIIDCGASFVISEKDYNENLVHILKNKFIPEQIEKSKYKYKRIGIGIHSIYYDIDSFLNALNKSESLSNDIIKKIIQINKDKLFKLYANDKEFYNRYLNDLETILISRKTKIRHWIKNELIYFENQFPIDKKVSQFL